MFGAFVEAGELLKGLVPKRDLWRSRKQGAKGKEDKKALSRAVKPGDCSRSCETCQLSCEVQASATIPPPALRSEALLKLRIDPPVRPVKSK